jgi:hypothetical protein
MREWTTLLDGINQLQQRTVPDLIEAELKDDEVLVKISCVSLNHRDAKSEDIPPLSSRTDIIKPNLVLKPNSTNQLF